MDKSVIVWDAAQWENGGIRQVAVLRDHQAAIKSVTFSPDGKLLVSASDAPDQRMIGWSVEQRFAKIGELPVSTSSSGPLFVPGTHQLMGWHNLSNVPAIWKADLEKPEAMIPEVDFTAGNWNALAPDGRHVISVGSEGAVSFLDLQSLKPRQMMRPHKDDCRSVAFSPDGKLFATAADDIALWDVASHTIIARFPHSAIVWSIIFSPDGRWLVSTHGDGAILLWDVQDRRLVANFNEHSDSVRGIAYSHDGKRIASASDDTSICIWDAGSGHKTTVLIGHQTIITGIAFTPDDERLASCDQHGAVILWDIAEARVLHTFASPFIRASYCLAVSPDGKWLATSPGVYDLAEGRQIVHFDFADSRYRDKLSTGSIYGMAFSPDGQRLACVCPSGGHIALFDTESWDVIAEAEVPDGQFISVSFSPDGEYLATGGDEKSVQLWQVNPLRWVATLGHHNARVKAVAFSPDGKHVVSTSDDQTIALWDVNSRRLNSFVGTHTAPVYAAAFSPDGKRLVSGEADHSVRVYTHHHILWGYQLD
jgi:WD40 repeat protein